MRSASKNIIIDASVAAKWFLTDEEDSDQALKIKQDLLKKEIIVSVPLFIFYEINNLLKSAAKSIRIEEKRAEEAYEGFLNLEFVIYSSKELLMAALETAFKFDISSYDASYVALADYLQVPLFTADQKLLRKIKSRFVKSLQTYPIKLNTK